MLKIQAIRGMKDLSPEKSPLWLDIEKTARRVALSAGYSYVHTPLLEMTELFKRGIGTQTDIVEKEMYTFEDRGGDHLALRPEGTAGVVRAAIENGWLIPSVPLKLFYFGSMYRRERPQKGRYRQFHQFGLELFEVSGPCGDAEVISLGWDFLNLLGLKDVELRLSTLGTTSCRLAYQEKLKNILKQNLDLIPKDFVHRIDSNPQRIFDHKDLKVKDLLPRLPLLLDHLDQQSQEHFQQVQEDLSEMQVPYTVDPHIVRGLDYYGHTAFEYTSPDLGPTQNAVGGGGRYDALVEQLGGRPTPAVGLAMGIERIVLLLEKQGIQPAKMPFVYLAVADSSFVPLALKWSRQLRLKGQAVQVDLEGRSLKSQMKRADKMGCSYVVIFGQSELENHQVTVRCMQSGEQQLIDLDHLESYLNQQQA